MCCVMKYYTSRDVPILSCVWLTTWAPAVSPPSLLSVSLQNGPSRILTAAKVVFRRRFVRSFAHDEERGIFRWCQPEGRLAPDLGMKLPSDPPTTQTQPYYWKSHISDDSLRVNIFCASTIWHGRLSIIRLHHGLIKVGSGIQRCSAQTSP